MWKCQTIVLHLSSIFAQEEIKRGPPKKKKEKMRSGRVEKKQKSREEEGAAT
jgi:hypothetical protein